MIVKVTKLWKVVYKMKKEKNNGRIVSALIILFLIVGISQACDSNKEEAEHEVNWGEYNDSSVERLKENRIDYKIKDGNIYIQEKDLSKAQNCCS